MPMIDDKYAIKLLRIQFKISRRLEELENVGVQIGGLNEADEIMDVILDSYGFPKDNTSKGQKAEEGQPVFCRDFIHDPFYNSVNEGSDSELQAVLDEWKGNVKDKSLFYWTEQEHH
ncbi:MAG: hypothetical protein ACPF9K_08000 [Neptuniibacter sp.]